MKKIITICSCILFGISSITYSQVVKIPITSSPVTVIVSGSIYYQDNSPSQDDPLCGVVIYYVSNSEDGSSNEAKILKGTTYYKSDPDTLIFTANSASDTLYIYALDFEERDTSSNPLLGEYNVDVNGITYTIDKNNIKYIVTGILENGYYSPREFSLKQNFPNPFNPSTTIEYQVSKLMNVKLNIYNSIGQLIKNLLNEEKSVGDYSIVWNGKDNNGNLVSSGTYYYQLQTGDYVQAKKMILIK
jgi:hypothetical protein